MSLILVIGASRGIGLELVRQYAQDGHRVIATVRDAGASERVQALGAEVLTVDVANPASVSGLAWQLDGEKIDTALYVAGVIDRASATSPPTREQFDYVRRLVADRRARPRDDLTTLAAFAPISEDECLWWCWAILIAGVETTRNVITGGLLALIEHPGEMARLRADPAGAREAAEELARWTLPVPAIMRVATEDTAIAGQPIAKGD